VCIHIYKHNEWDLIWMEVIVAHFEVLPGHILGLKEENKKFCQESGSQRWDLNPDPRKYEARVLTNQSRSSFEETWFSVSAGCIPRYCLPATKIWRSLPRTRTRIRGHIPHKSCLNSCGGFKTD